MLTGVFWIIAGAGLADPHDVSVPRRTPRRKFRPARYATVGAVPAGGAAEFAVPVPARARRGLLTAAVGQEGAGCAFTGCVSALSVTRRRKGQQ